MTRDTKFAAREKHLKSIYELLNRGCNKKAVQDIDKLPKNIKNLTVFKALKSLALIRMYKRRQAFDVLNEIDPEDDLDEVTLQTMTSCYKESVDVGRIVDLYEAASRRNPNDQDIMAHLFMAHVRVFNFKRQKEIALQMYRSFPKKKRLYSFWAIMSLVMQSQGLMGSSNSCDQNAADKRVCLSLAEKMSEKMIDDERTHEEIELYLMILRKQSKHEEEYKFLTGPICPKPATDHLSWFDRRRAYLCLDLKMYSRAFKHYFPSLIIKYPDQIEYYQGLFKSAFLLDTEAPSQQQPVALNDQQQQQSQTTNQTATGTPVKSTSALAECYDIVEKQCFLTMENATEPPVNREQPKQGKGGQGAKALSRTPSLNPNRRRLLRGPFMARIQLYNMILTNESVLPKNVFSSCKNQFTNRYPTLTSLLLDYFQSFSRKIICHYDLDYMINEFNLTNEAKQQLVTGVSDWIQEITKNQQQDLMSSYDLFHIILNYYLLKHSLHHYQVTDSRESRLEMSKNFIDLYDENRNLGKCSNKTEFQPVDNYCLLAINSIMTNALESTNLTNQSILSDSIILSLIVLAENAVANSPSNHQLKLTLLKLYSFIGASKQCSEILLSLDIKHFQIDTLGHLLNPVLYNTGNYSLSRESLETCLEFYAHGVRECFEGLTASYRDGRFSKIEEISSVLKKLCDSLNATQCVLLKGVVANLGAESLDDLNLACQSFDPFKGLHRMFRCTSCTDTTIRDNRDLKVLKSLNAETNRLIQQRRDETLSDEQLWLKLRYYLLRSSYLQLEYFSDQCRSIDGSDKEGHLAELALGHEMVEDSRLKLDIAVGLKSKDQRYSYFEPESSPFRWTHCVEFQTLISLVTPVIFLTDPSTIDTKIQEEYNSCLDKMVSHLEVQLSAIKCLVDMKQALLSLTLSIEFISLACTSLASIGNNASSANHSASKKATSSQQQQAPIAKSKSILNQMISKTEAQLTRLSNMIKNIESKSLILDKIIGLEETLLSKPEQSRLENASASVLIPLLGREALQSTFGKVKEKLVDSYNESFKEIETTCRRKVKLLRPRDS